MTFQEAADLAGEVGTVLVIPGHFDMFAHNGEDPAKEETAEDGHQPVKEGINDQSGSYHFRGHGAFHHRSVVGGVEGGGKKQKAGDKDPAELPVGKNKSNGMKYTGRQLEGSASFRNIREKTPISCFCSFSCIVMWFFLPFRLKPVSFYCIN